MYLVCCATSFEMDAFVAAWQEDAPVARLVSGIGLVETALRLTTFLHHQDSIQGVINFGVAGAYMGQVGRAQAGLLDLCLARCEVLGDLGICLEDRVERFGATGLEVADIFRLDSALLVEAEKILEHGGQSWYTGTFVTVSCASGTAARGALLAHQYDGLCENMEGAAVARVCEEFGLPCLEIRCISNMVEDRNRDNWRLAEACELAGRAAADIAAALGTSSGIRRVLPPDGK
ncbi:futalosine hydrolase [Desulfolithobacter sp.]